jgi:peptidoglycan hydrolase-like protein with peptidoglycan-binding domain
MKPFPGGRENQRMALQIGDRGAAVRRLQRQLNAEGFNCGDADGIFGARTRRAVEQFQRAHGLRVDGAVGEDTTAALRRELNTDRFEDVPQPGLAGIDGTARIERTLNEGRRRQRVDGTMTVNGHAYHFRSGGYGRGSLPTGTYTVTPHLWSRNDRSMSVGGVGYSFAVSDKYDPRVGGTRRLLRIHPDGGSPGTEGCIGIVGGAEVQRRFREDMRRELERNGGRYTLRVA